MAWLQIAGGLVLLTGGAEGLVRGASSLAARLGISSLVIGLTVVAYGTSAPEMAVSVAASLRGSEGIALGNVVGSNITNLGLVLGLSALIRPLRAQAGLLRRELPFMLAAALMVPALGWDGTIGRGDGVVLLLGAFLFTSACLVRALAENRALRQRTAEGIERDGTGEIAIPVALIYLALGSVALVVGGDVLVRGATTAAHRMGVSDRIIGLSVVALGTSLPELATSLVAARHGELDLAVGNVIGSNIFNVFFILGTAALLHPMPVGASALSLDVVLMILLSLAMVPIVLTGERISRVEGVLLALVYGGFVLSLFHHGT